MKFKTSAGVDRISSNPLHATDESSNRGVLPVAVLALSLTLAACSTTGTKTADGAPARTGYRHGNIYPAQVHSVAVPIFTNKTFTTGIERDITDALIKEIQVRTPYFVAPSASADTELVGTIVSVEKSRLNRARGSGLVREMVLNITVDFEWRDSRTGRVYAARKNFQAGDEYVSSLPVNERPEIGRIGAAQAMARQIVAAMRDQW